MTTDITDTSGLIQTSVCAAHTQPDYFCWNYFINANMQASSIKEEYERKYNDKKTRKVVLSKVKPTHLIGTRSLK